MVFEIHPDSIEAHKTCHLIKCAVGIMQRCDERRLILTQLGFNSAESHTFRLGLQLKDDFDFDTRAQRQLRQRQRRPGMASFLAKDFANET